jgi:hypothetical protein
MVFVSFFKLLPTYQGENKASLAGQGGASVITKGVHRETCVVDTNQQ